MGSSEVSERAGVVALDKSVLLLVVVVVLFDLYRFVQWLGRLEIFLEGILGLEGFGFERVEPILEILIVDVGFEIVWVCVLVEVVEVVKVFVVYGVRRGKLDSWSNCRCLDMQYFAGNNRRRD